MAMLPKHEKPSERRTSRLVWLLTAHLVSSYFMFTQAQTSKPADFSIEVTPRYPTEGENVTLVPQKPSNDTVSCLWYRGENETYLEIVLYFPSNNTFMTKSGFQSGHMPLPDCVLAIRNVSYLDMALYGMIMKLPAKTLFGEAFLMVTREQPEIKRKKGLGAGLIAGISAGCLIGILLVIGLVAYQTRGTPFRAATQPADSSGAQTAEVATNQNPETEGNKI